MSALGNRIEPLLKSIAPGARSRYAVREVLIMALSAQKRTTQLPSMLPPDEARAMFDEVSQRITGLPGEEFLQRWEAGEFRDIEDTPEGRKISYLVMLIPFGRQNS